ncbi:hypothetical protein a10_00897 [Streptomyces acidiscabies]|nr:hypothetical protein a10_00897 [Streptomyces acidiscabies]GAV38898.1 hypothetical protein Saa2_01780 [Streptomyces acidiscabies]
MRSRRRRCRRGSRGRAGTGPGHRRGHRVRLTRPTYGTCNRSLGADSSGPRSRRTASKGRRTSPCRRRPDSTRPRSASPLPSPTPLNRQRRQHLPVQPQPGRQLHQLLNHRTRLDPRRRQPELLTRDLSELRRGRLRGPAVLLLPIPPSYDVRTTSVGRSVRTGSLSPLLGRFALAALDRPPPVAAHGRSRGHRHGGKGHAHDCGCPPHTSPPPQLRTAPPSSRPPPSSPGHCDDPRTCRPPTPLPLQGANSARHAPTSKREQGFEHIFTQFGRLFVFATTSTWAH